MNKEINSSSVEEVTIKKSGKEDKNRKSIDQVLKALNSLDSTEEKLAAMCKKYAEIIDENRKLQVSLKQAEKRITFVQREKEALQTEHSKAVLTRSRLQSLCRELQRQNKAVKDESLLKIREEEEKRKEVSAKFQDTLANVTTLLQQNNEKNSKLHEANLEMAKNFKSVCEQYELREQQVEKISKQLQLENKLADARLANAKLEMTAEKEILIREKQQLLLELTECQAKIKDMQQTETNLRGQISLYTSKYDDFQGALSRSNEIFAGFKGEMEKMSKKILKLEKETSSWKQRWEKSHQALLEMAADKQQRDSDLALASKQIAQLQKLCRTLQIERTSLLTQLKNNNTTNSKDGESTSSPKLQKCEEKCKKKGNSNEQSETTCKLDHDVKKSENQVNGNCAEMKDDETKLMSEEVTEKQTNGNSEEIQREQVDENSGKVIENQLIDNNEEESKESTETETPISKENGNCAEP